MNATAAIPHINGWFTYDVTFTLSRRRGARSWTFFAPDDAAAHDYATARTTEAANELSDSLGRVTVTSMHVSRR